MCRAACSLACADARPLLPLTARLRSPGPAQTLFDFVRVTLADLGTDVKGFDVGCNMPRRVFSASSDLTVDLRTAQLCPQAVVFVTPTQ